MIKVYCLKDFKNRHKLLETIANNNDLWDYPEKELLYLAQDHDKESFLFAGNRFFEINEEILNKFLKESE